MTAILYSINLLSVDLFVHNSQKNLAVFIVIPAFNEASVIAATIKNLQDHGWHNIVVVNDASTDATQEIACCSGVIVLNHIVNRGYGAALRTGINYVAMYTDAAIAITYDADGQHRPEDIPALVDAICNGYDVALGSRFLGTAHDIPIARKITLKMAIVFTALTSGIILSDAHNGFRALSHTAMSRIKTHARGMEYASEIIDEIKKRHLSYKEVPVTVIYTDYSKQKGQSSGNAIKIALKVLIKKLFL